jgi:HEPN superfamily AbiU2-like protein
MKVAQYKEKEFEELRQKLHKDIAGAHDEFVLSTALEKARTKSTDAFAQSRVFWNLTINALLNSAIARLCRVYDNEYAGIQMYLRIVSEHQEWFNKPHVSKAPPKLREYPQPFKASTLNGAIRSVSTTPDSPKNNLVDQLLDLRNTQVAHIGTTFTCTRRPRPKNPLDFRGFKSLLYRAHRLLNTYSSFYDGTTYTKNIVGIHDFKFVDDAIRRHFEKIRSAD